MEPVLGIIAVLLLGAGALLAILCERTRQLGTVLRERDEARGERDTKACELADARAEISAYKGTNAAREKALKERRWELETHFKGIAFDMVNAFLKQAEERAGKNLQQRQSAVG